jgi:hypothetical protein
MVLQISRPEFLDEYFDYRPGEHLNAIYPTRRGKTHLVYQCLRVAMRQNPHLSAVSLMPKPKDDATAAWAAALGLRETPVWPPRRWPFTEGPPGWVLWPRHTRNLPADQRRALIAAQLRACLNDQYWRGDSITFADDVYVAAVLMGLNPECEEFWTAGGSNRAGLWSANQKPSGTLGGGSVSSFSYNAPTHLFLGKDTDDRNVRRFGEIGGVDPREVESIVRNLRLFSIDGNSVSEVLYIDKRGPYMAVIGP